MKIYDVIEAIKEDVTKAGYNLPNEISISVDTNVNVFGIDMCKVSCIVHKKDGTPVSFSKSASYSVPVPAS